MKIEIITTLSKMRCFFVLFCTLTSSLNAFAANTGTRYEETTNHVDYLEVARTNVILHVPDIGATYEVSDRLPLIHQSQEYYIVGIPRFDGTLQAAAFPLMVSRKQGTGWVTNDKFLIFASQVRSTAGQLELELRETLAIRSRHQNHYEVELQRGGRSVVLRIPEGMGGIVLKKKEVIVRTPIPMGVIRNGLPARANKSSTRPGRKISVSQGEEGILIEDAEGNLLNKRASLNEKSAAMLQTAQINFLPPTPATSPVSGAAADVAESGTRERVIQELKEVVMLEIVAELQKSKSQRNPGLPYDPALRPEASNGEGHSRSELEFAMANSEMSTASNLAGQLGPEFDGALAASLESRVRAATQVLNQAASDAVQAAVGNHPEFEEKESALLRFLKNYSLMFQILFGVCILEGVLLFNMRLKNRRMEKTPEPESDGQAYSYNISGEAMISQPEPEYAQAAEGDLSGTLDGYSMGQVVQFFNSSGDEGILTLTTDGDQEDLMIFNNGQIIAAASGELSGEEAVYAILRRQHGNFSFRRIDTSDHERVILQDTMSLLLEGHRLVDEQGFDAA
jgi:hypothetical protein